MRALLSRAYPSLNKNKINGIYAEVDFYRHIDALGFAGRVSPGGWIIRSTGPGHFGQQNLALFPEAFAANQALTPGRTPQVPSSVDAAASWLHALGVGTLFCYPEVGEGGFEWSCVQRGLPTDSPPQSIRGALQAGFELRTRRNNPLRWNSDVSVLDDDAVQAVFPLESLRVAIQASYMMELSDLDRLIWGRRSVYPVEIKEKTPVLDDRRVGSWFGIDAGPFAKLAFFAATSATLNSLFVVREINNTQDRDLVNWWVIEFRDLARYVSWVPQAGGTSMGGTASTVLKIPVDAFRPLDYGFLSAL